MRDNGWNLPLVLSASRVRARRLAREVRANAQLRYAALLGTVGLGLLCVTVAIGLQRQRSLESHVARVAPLDDSGSVYYLVDSTVEPIVPPNHASSAGLKALPSVAIAMLLAAAVMAIWYVSAGHHRQDEERRQRHRRWRPVHSPVWIRAKRQALRMLLGNDARSQDRSRLTVRQLMNESFVVAPPTASIHTLTSLLASHSSRQVMICEYGGRLLGIVTDRDLHFRRGRRAADVMSRNPVCVPPGAVLGPAVATMVDHQVSCLPVVEQGRVRGVLTLNDVALALECILHARDAAPAGAAALGEETALLSDIQTLCMAARPADAGERPEAQLPREGAP